MFQAPTGRLIHSNKAEHAETPAEARGFKPQRAASSIPTCTNNVWLMTRCLFQTPTGRLIHSNGDYQLDIEKGVIVSNPNGPPHPFQQVHVAARTMPLDDVSSPNGPPHPFQHHLQAKGPTRPLRFQTPTGRLIHSNGCRMPRRAAPSPSFQTPTGRLIHSNLPPSYCTGPPLVFQTPTGRLIHSNPGYCAMDACPTQWFQTPTGRLIHSNSESWNAWRHTLTFQTPTGRLIHSNLLVSFLCPSLRLVSNPNGPPHPFQLGVMECLEAYDDVSNPNGPPHPFQRHAGAISR